jgi:hypothetical protein
MGTTEDGRFLIVSLDNGELLFHDINTGKPVVRFWVKTNGELFVSDELGNYHASTTGFQPYKMKYNGVIYDFQYIDLTYNRPDILIKKLGYADEQLVGIYTDAVKKRALMQGGGVSTNLLNIPQINITNMPDQFITSENFMVLEGKVENSPTGENKLKLTVNGHPQLMDLENPQRLQVPINLNKGANYIEMAIVDKSGIIFPSQQWILYSKKEKGQRNLVVCVLSVSKYMDNTYNLTYARKDGEDIVQTFAAQSMNYDKVYFHQLYDQQVTLEKIDSLFTSISVSPNDRLIVFISGHGLLDAEKEFYYATHDVDFEDPKNRGFSFDQLQSYMSDINTPEKLLLIDACHSGLVDKTESEKRPEATEPSEVKLSNVFAAKGTKALNIEANEVTLKNSFELMQELFQNFSSFTGTETITAASGNSWALESSKWKNGAFTFVIKKGLLEFEADLNNNGTITIDELKKYVTKEVLRLTNGAQKPTSRETNDYLDWVVWD